MMTLTKCAYQQMQKGKTQPDNTNKGKRHSYLAIVKNISYVGLINKNKVAKEYYNQRKKEIEFKTVIIQ